MVLWCLFYVISRGGVTWAGIGQNGEGNPPSLAQAPQGGGVLWAAACYKRGAWAREGRGVGGGGTVGAATNLGRGKTQPALDRMRSRGNPRRGAVPHGSHPIIIEIGTLPIASNGFLGKQNHHESPSIGFREGKMTSHSPLDFCFKPEFTQNRWLLKRKTHCDCLLGQNAFYLQT